MVEGFDDLHSDGLVHRDLKLENVKIAKDGTGKLLDFALCIKVTIGLLLAAGTSLSASPEMVCLSRYNEKADVWHHTVQHGCLKHYHT